jgi:hypothetical protein
MDAITAASAEKPSTAKKNVLSYYLQVKGVFGRNRSSKFKVFTVIQDQPVTRMLTFAEIDAMAMGVLAEVKLKSGAAALVEQPEEIDHHAGFTSRSYMMFTGVRLWQLQRTPGADDVITYGGK